MAPDRPDGSAIETVSSPSTVTRLLNNNNNNSSNNNNNNNNNVDRVMTINEDDTKNCQNDNENNQNMSIDKDILDNTQLIDQNLIKNDNHDTIITTKQNQTDDDLTSLTWLHQQNLLKGLELPAKVNTDDTIINNNNNNNNSNNNNINNICEDSGDYSENTNSISSHEETYYPENNNRKAAGILISKNGQTNNTKIYDKQINIYQDTSKNIIQNNGTHQIKISLNSNNNNNNINNNNNNIPVANRNKHPTHLPYDPYLHRSSKPPYSFSCLIFMAIEDSPIKALPVKEVYAWILEHFPYFRTAQAGWKNSVRHNLSLNKCFRKVDKAPNLGKGSLWKVDNQHRPNLLQALSRAPFPRPLTQNITTTDNKQIKKTSNTRLPDPILFPYLFKKLASSNMNDNQQDSEFDSDVDAAAVAMLSFKHGPIILNHNKERKGKKLYEQQDKLVPVITRSSSEDHTYSCIASPKTNRSSNTTADERNNDVEEERKTAEGADALLNLASIALSHNNNNNINNNINSRLINQQDTTTNMPLSQIELTQKTTVKSSQTKSKRRTATTKVYMNIPDTRRKHWPEWRESNRYIKGDNIRRRI